MEPTRRRGARRRCSSVWTHWVRTGRQSREANSKVATTLGPLETREPGTTARLLHHAWVLTRVSGYVLHAWGDLGDIDDWRRARFEALVNGAV